MEDHKKLRRNLVRAADTSLRRFYQQPGDRNVRQYPTLARVIQDIVGEERWRSQTAQATVETLYAAIQALPERFSDHSPERNIGNGKWVDSPERHMAEVLYGYRDDDIEPRIVDGATLPLSYDQDRIPAALKLARGVDSKRTERRVTEVIREDIATELLKMAKVVAATKQSVPDEKPNPQPVAGPNRYVARPALEQSLGEAIEASRGSDMLVLVYGQGGMGKTRLVREYFKDMDHVFMQMNSSQLLEDSILDALEALGMADDLVEGSPQRRFQKMLESPHAPAYVILDDVANVEPLQIVLSTQRPSTVVVATARSNLLPAGYGTAFQIGPMEREEAFSLLSQQNSQRSHQEMRTLSATLGGHPLAIKQAAAYLRRYVTVPIDEFREALRRHSVEVLPLLPVELTDTPLLGIYQEVIARLSGTLALKLLEARAFMAMPYISLRRHLEAYGRAVSELPTTLSSIVKSQIDQALDELKALALIDGDENFITIHPLTHSVLRGLFHATGEEACNTLLEALPSVDLIGWLRELHKTMGDDYYDDPKGHALIRRADWVIYMEEAEVSRLRAELYPSHEYRSQFRRVLATMYFNYYIMNIDNPVGTYPYALDPYFRWLVTVFARRHAGEPFGDDMWRLCLSAAEEAIELFMPTEEVDRDAAR